MTEELTTFINDWNIDPNKVKAPFCSYVELLSHEGISSTFTVRPHISFSLRSKGAAQSTRDLFVVLDVIDDEPENRWLSVCFYADMVTDPDDCSDFVPAGLFGEDARCFTLDADDPKLAAYIADRLREAIAAATGTH